MVNKNLDNIITEEGLFYSNFSDRFRAGLATIEASNYYSEHLVWLRDNYGIRVGKPHPYPNGEMPKDSRVVGVYIVDYPKYLKDKQEQLQALRNENDNGRVL